MATATTDKNRCAICSKEKRTVRCEGCSQTFCYSHLGDHRQELSQQLDEVEVTRDVFRETLTEHISQPQNHPLMQKIDDWERDSINRVRQTAKELRQLLSNHTSGYMAQIEVQLNKLTNQLRQSREENDFVETDLNQWKAELSRLKEELTKPSNITLYQDSTPFITKIVVDVKSGMYARYICNNISKYVAKDSVAPESY
jgi:chromosome condensin MukBEF ATPase and DNA-binding subunit MukB